RRMPSARGPGASVPIETTARRPGPALRTVISTRALDPRTTRDGSASTTGAARAVEAARVRTAEARAERRGADTAPEAISTASFHVGGRLRPMWGREGRAGRAGVSRLDQGAHRGLEGHLHLVGPHRTDDAQAEGGVTDHLVHRVGVGRPVVPRRG